MIGMPRGFTTAPISSSRKLPRCSSLPSTTTIATGSAERPVEVVARLDFDEMAADHPHRLVIGETLSLRDDDPVYHSVGERQAQHLYRIVAGDAGRRPERHRSGAAAGDDAPFRPGQLGEPLSGRLHQFVEIDKMARRLGHRLADLRQHQAAAMHRPHAAAIDERPHAEHEIGIGVLSWHPGIDQRNYSSGCRRRHPCATPGGPN